VPSLESSMENLAKARARSSPPRPWRSKEESEIVRRFVFWWFTSRGSKPSGRAWARGLGISHTWLLKLIRQFTVDPSEMLRLQRAYGDPKSAQLNRAQEQTREMRERGELRVKRQGNRANPNFEC